MTANKIRAVSTWKTGTSGTRGRASGPSLLDSVVAPVNPVTPSARMAAITMPARGWFSGGAGYESDSYLNNTPNPNKDAFANWRGSELDSTSTWLDPAGGAGWGWGLLATPPYGAGTQDPRALDLSIGGPAEGQWDAVAGGSLDTALRGVFTRLRAARIVDGILRTTIVRPAHEMNGSWYPWSVRTSADATNFRLWGKRIKAIRDEVFPECLLACCFNGETSGGQPEASTIWEDGTWDLLGVDRYNQYPYIGTSKPTAPWEPNITTTWASGSTRGTENNPVGIEKWRQFALTRGVPMYIPEYANSANHGDDAYWVNQFFAWVQTHKGKGPGQLFMENWFNIEPGGYDESFWLEANGGTQTNSRMPNTVAAYNALF